MKASSGLTGYGNGQCVSGVCEVLGTVSLYGHNQDYKIYDIDRVVEYPDKSKLSSVEAENKGYKRHIKLLQDIDCSAKALSDLTAQLDKANEHLNIRGKKYDELLQSKLALLATTSWIPVSERLPEYIKGLKESYGILILDEKLVERGNYHNGNFEYWNGSFCNTDKVDSQKTITHWKPIILPPEDKKLEQAESKSTLRIFNCKHYIHSAQQVPIPFGNGSCSEEMGECKIESASDVCDFSCSDYEQAEGKK